MTDQKKPHILDVIAALFNEQPDAPSTDGFNLKKPPGLVGEVTDYINSQCRYPLENLAVIAAFVAVGNIGGLTTRLHNSKISSNLFAFCVAGSSVGKESVLQAINELHIQAGISAAIHGTIKSEQEIIKNLIRHQASYYNIDELGIFLRKIVNSQKSGGASYLQGVIGMLMSVYSKASGRMLLSGDLKEEIKESLIKEIVKLNKKIDDKGFDQAIDQRIQDITTALNEIDKGLLNPFLSVIGFTTPSTFNECVNFEQVTSGFVGRSLIINEPNTNPRRKHGFVPGEMSKELKTSLDMLRINGNYSTVNSGRVEGNGNFNYITTTNEASQALEDAFDWFEDEAERHTEKTGFEAVVRRGGEMVEKLSFILSIGKQERGILDVSWALAYVKRDIEFKTRLAYSNVSEKTDPIKSMAAKIMCCIGHEGTTAGKIANRYRSKKSLVYDAIDLLEKSGKIRIEDKIKKPDNKLYQVIYKLD